MAVAPRLRSVRNLVEAFALGFVAGRALQVAFDGGGLLTLALLRRLLVILAAAQLCQDTGLLAGALEAAQRGVKILILFYTNTGHTNSVLLSKHK